MYKRECEVIMNIYDSYSDIQINILKNKDKYNKLFKNLILENNIFLFL